MGWFAFLIVGLLAGWIAEKVMGRSHGLVMNLIVGVIGAYLGAFLLGLVGMNPIGEGFIAALITAVLGAVVLLWVVGKLRGRG